MAFFLRPNSQVMTDTNGNMFAELYADEATDLADNLEGVDLAAGSIALVIATHNFYVLNSSGTWVNQNAEDTPAASVNSTKSLTVNIEEQSERKIDESSEKTEDEPEKEKESEQNEELDRSAESNTRATSKR